MSMSGICAMRGNVMEYFKPGEQMRMMCYSVMTQAYSEKGNSECSYQESNLRPSDYQFGRSTTEPQETRGSLQRPLN